jgi:2-dehydro-3-deoxyglucarate aldolase
MPDTPHIRFRDRLARREPLLGTLLTLPSPDIAELLAGAGFDWLFIDMEHGLLDFEIVQRMVQAAGSACPCLVRVAYNEPILIGKALDTGAAGIIVPHVGTPEEARAAVRAAKYPPTGARSIGAGRAQGYGRRIQGAIAGDNDSTVVVAQVEHADAVPQMDEIVAVRGVSAVFVGPFDLSASMGKPGEIDAPEVRQAIGAIVAACSARSLPCGLFVGDGDAARRAFSDGHSLVCAATDTLLIGEAAGRLRSAAAPEGGGGRG